MTSVAQVPPPAVVLAAPPGAVPVLTVPEAAVGMAGGPVEWAAAHRGTVDRALAEHGVLLLRGLAVASPGDVAAVARALGVEPAEEVERFAARRIHADGVYGSSEWPPDEAMCMHHEVSHAAEVPSIAVFGCLTAPGEGGVTAVADSGEVLRALPADLVASFERVGWQLTRTYREVGVAWTEAFGTQDPQRVSAYCARAGIDHEWLPDMALRTRQCRAAVVRHPVSGERIWFNQIAFLNELTLDSLVREYLTDVYGPDSLPFNTAYGDGSPIPDEVIDTINQAYQQATRREPWQSGDLMLLDNLRMAHSREPYEGEREIVVILGRPVRLAGHVLP